MNMNTTAHADMMQEDRVLEAFARHASAFESGDLDAVLSDFDRRAVVITPDGVFDGLDRIRTLYQGLLDEFGVIDRGDSPGFTFDTLYAHGDTMFVTWHAASVRHVFPYGSDTFVCEGDKFVRQSIAFSAPRPRTLDSEA
jgi:ketosteroid isomerase-like protein